MHANVSKKHFLGSCHHFWDKSRVGRFQWREWRHSRFHRKEWAASVNGVVCPDHIFNKFENIWKYSKIFKRCRKYYEMIGHSVWAEHLVKQILEPKKIKPQPWASSKDNLGPEHSGARDLRPKFDSHSAWRMAFVMAWRTKRMSSLPPQNTWCCTLGVLGAIPSHAVHISGHACTMQLSKTSFPIDLFPCWALLARAETPVLAKTWA